MTPSKFDEWVKTLPLEMRMAALKKVKRLPQVELTDDLGTAEDLQREVEEALRDE